MVRWNDARSRSMRLTAIMVGREDSAAAFQSFSVWTSMPATAETMSSAESATRSPCTASVV